MNARPCTTRWRTHTHVRTGLDDCVDLAGGELVLERLDELLRRRALVVAAAVGLLGLLAEGLWGRRKGQDHFLATSSLT